jgi:hypothetical protein
VDEAGGERKRRNEGMNYRITKRDERTRQLVCDPSLDRLQNDVVASGGQFARTRWDATMSPVSERLEGRMELMGAPGTREGVLLHSRWASRDSGQG